MSVLLLRLAGPLQAWGTRSRFAHRHTDVAPSKSGVIGLLAAARGLRRTDPLTELLPLRFGVRIDQPGEILRDFHVARTLDGRTSMPLTYRHYLADAAFLAAVSGPPALLDSLQQALSRPYFPLFLGRRSCPPAGPVSLGVHDGMLRERLATWPWQAAGWKQRRQRGHPAVRLEILRDAESGDPLTETAPDQAVSFDPRHRRHSWRSVVREHTDIPNPAHHPAPGHDPMDVLEGWTCS
ncbi:type I-E CRISPR-associated protein Cas5/CasD [Couchioplanes caeruleus]|uniref:Type I-E CRISPR-associated protein Cas5/CasD n=2 Tax=Couchioplanes caeruleus TaxID=56438 RepID=A0A1K0GS77_9ACTN|nr:type I-E CRISPR-associated protein Cas5/CasD [Couchioplanes caeruleus]OJF12139.1 type I-E CRISPR-associated protein Cas5/CasD [Couchioplanes caeruleus subsp. caeruleus]ROP28984.1 CRISPR-associated Cas5e family protein [Couchioplanes caeruleus]